jgi:hypothetical protein
MHTRFSNKIPKYSQVSVPPLIGQKSPAEQRFVGGVFALSACYIGNAAGLLCCLRDSALFALWFIRLVFNNRWLWSIGIRCFLWLRIRPPALSPTRSPALSPTLPRAWCPATASGRHGLVRLVRIFRCKPLRLPSGTWSACTLGTGLPGLTIHAPVLRSEISALKTSAASTLCSRTGAPEASAASAGHRSTLHHHVPASIILAAWTQTSTDKILAGSTGASALSTPDVLVRPLAERAVWTWRPIILTGSTRPSALPALEVLVRTLGIRAIWTRYPGVVRLFGLEVCPHSRSAAHSGSPSWTTAGPSATTATLTAARAGKSFCGKNCQCKSNNYRCFDSCRFHFWFLSLTFHFSAFLSPLLGSFYPDSGAGAKKVTPIIMFSRKFFVLSIKKTGRLKTYPEIFAAVYFTSMLRLSCISGITAKN